MHAAHAQRYYFVTPTYLRLRHFRSVDLDIQVREKTFKKNER